MAASIIHIALSTEVLGKTSLSCTVSDIFGPDTFLRLLWYTWLSHSDSNAFNISEIAPVFKKTMTLLSSQIQQTVIYLF